jgi:phosphatidylserine/phosphatidylglycerophosphate/cardiolipin synthase-like enzyme
VQIAVEGDVAAALGELARERWHRATGRRLRPPEPAYDVWPAHVRADLENVPVAIARTEPEHDGRSAVEEVARLHVEAIAAAKHCIYIESQYLTATVIADALAARLEADEGPSIIIVAPAACSGWLEDATMGRGRACLLERLRTADRHGRLRVYAPTLAGADSPLLNVHSKVTIIDDAMVRIGSANMSNRSMGLDTECDLAIESRGDPRIVAAIRAFRERLLAEHLGVTRAEVGDMLDAAGSLGAAIDRLRVSGGRTLEPLETSVSDWPDPMAPAVALLDPERPMMPQEMLVGAFRSRASKLFVGAFLAVLGAVVTGVLGLPRGGRGGVWPLVTAVVMLALAAALWLRAARPRGAIHAGMDED